MAAFFASLLAHKRTVSTILCLLALLRSTALSLSSSSSSSTSICYPPDRAALQVVATSFSRSSSAAHSFFRLHWRAELDCCFWLGVTCSSRSIFDINATTKSSMASNDTAHANPKVMSTYSRVVGLSLNANKWPTDYWETAAIMSIPLAVCRLSALASLDLSEITLVGSIPSCIGHNLTSLKTLNLSGNSHLSGSLAPLANLSLLSRLDLSENSFNTSSMSSFSSSNFTHLTHLDLSGNSLSGTLSPFRFLTSLKTLILSYNSHLSGSLSLLANLSLLSHLDLSRNFLSGTLFPLKFNTLGYLDLSYNQFSGSLSPASFSTVPLLQYLDISGNNGLMAHDLGLVLERLPHLEQLHTTMAVSAINLGSLLCKARSLKSLEASLSIWDRQESDAGYAANNHLHDQLPCEKVASARSLTDLSLQGQGLTGPLPTWFGDFSRLQWLDLSGNNFQGSIPQEWQALTQLTVLAISGDSPSTPVLLSQEVQSWLFRLPLEVLVLTSMGLTSQDFPCVAGFSLLNHTLHELDLSDNHISPGYALWHCLQHHNFSFTLLSLSNNSLALNLDQQHDLAFGFDFGWLDLTFCQLSGSVSNIVEWLPWAMAMFLGHNNLTGSIPSQIGSLGSSLEALDLSHNQLTGTIPSSIWNLTNVEYLNLQSNSFCGEVVAQSQQGAGGGLPAYYLSFSYNYLTKASFANVTTSLAILDLGMNKLEGTIEDLLGDQPLVLTSLNFLLLDNNQLTGSIPTSLGTSAPALIAIDLSNNKLTGAIPHSLHRLEALYSKLPVTPFALGMLFPHVPASLKWPLTLPSHEITFGSVKNVNSSPMHYRRGHLDLSSNQLSGSIPEGLGALLGLNDLDLSRNQLTGPIPPSLAHLLNLESLDLSFNNLQGSIPMAFSNLTSLEVFNVSFNPQLSGQIPAGPQLENPTSYEGDYNLCGEPLQKDCHEQQQIVTPYIQKHKSKVGIKRSISLAMQGIEEWAAIPGICIGYVLGVGLTIWALKMLHFYK